MLEYRIELTVISGLRTKSCFVILRDDTPTLAFRRAEVVMPMEADAETFIADIGLPSLWAIGEDADEADYDAVAERPLAAPIYRPIIRKIFPALAGSADLGLVRGQLDNYLQQSPDLAANFNAAMSKLGVDTSTPEGKREQLSWLILMALAGLVNGD